MHSYTQTAEHWATQGMDRDSLKQLRKDLRKLARQKQALESRQRQEQVSTSVAWQMTTVLVLVLSDSESLALAWAFQRQRKRPLQALSHNTGVSSALLKTWLAQWGRHGAVMAALQSLEHPWRAAADKLLMGSLLVDRFGMVL